MSGCWSGELSIYDSLHLVNGILWLRAVCDVDFAMGKESNLTLVAESFGMSFSLLPNVGGK